VGGLYLIGWQSSKPRRHMTMDKGIATFESRSGYAELAEGVFLPGLCSSSAAKAGIFL